jgi:hypothetical protein
MCQCVLRKSSSGKKPWSKEEKIKRTSLFLLYVIYQLGSLTAVLIPPLFGSFFYFFLVFSVAPAVVSALAPVPAVVEPA